MSGLLVVEHSATLANLLQRALVAGGHRDVVVHHDFDEASEAAAAGDFEAVIIGIPHPYDGTPKSLMRLMTGAEHRRVPFLMLVHTPLPQLVRFAERRGHAEVLPWQRFSRIPGMVTNMVTRPRLERAQAPEAVRQSVRILFVDDSQSARYAYGKLLESQGFPVDVAAGVAEAKERAAAGAYDLIIVDYYLPDGTGAELCAQLREMELANAPTLAMITGSYREPIIHQCLQAGAVECMFKNEARELFLTRVQAIARSIESHRAVQAERERLDGILASVGDGVYGVSERGEITFVNQRGVELLGCRSEEELLGRLAQDRIHGARETTDTETLAECYAAGSRLSGFETLFQRTDGEPFPVECTVFPLSIQARRQGSVVVFRDISERKTVEQWRWEATHDDITGLLNRRQFSQQLERALEPLREDGGYGALLHIDLDRFGDVIETVGAEHANEVLADVAARISTRLRDADVLARLEDDKFALLLPGIRLTHVFTLADSFRAVLGEVRIAARGAEWDLSGSVGVIILSRSTPSAEYALEHARVACETAKKKGRNQVHVDIPEEDAKTKHELESSWTERFKDAICNDRFVFLAQPILRANPSPCTEGEPREMLFELLLRMVGQDGQWISPKLFVPLAERVNMAQEIDLWVVRRAARLLETWHDPRCRVCFTVNLSNVTLQDPTSLKRVREAIQSMTRSPDRLIFEMTETSELSSLQNARKLMLELKKIGCRFALDDFGTGFSSFSHIKHLPVDFIKIDGLFVQSMASNDVDRTVVDSITGMAHALGLATIAEHVDARSTLEAARTIGVDYVQGHLLGEPARVEDLDLEDFLATA